MSASEGHHETVKLLCEQEEVDLEAYTKGDDNIYTALGCSCEHGKDKVLEVLLHNKADINAPIEMADIGKTTGLREASRFGHLDVIQLLLDAKAAVGGDDGGAPYPPICDAAGSGSLDAVELLLGRKADAWSKSADGASAIGLALQNAHSDVFHALLQRPDFPATEYRGLVALTLQQDDSVDFLSSLIDRASTLEGDPDLIDLNQPARAGESTALSTAVAYGSSNDHINMLLDHKVDANRAQTLNRTPKPNLTLTLITLTL